MKKYLGKFIYKAKERLLYDPLYLKPQVREQRYVHIQIRTLHTKGHIDTAMEFYKNYLQAGFGDTETEFTKANWWENSLEYMIVLEDVYSNELLGGVRLIIADEHNLLPMENIIRLENPDIVPRIHKFNHIVGEICSLWTRKDFKERGLELILLRSVLSVASKIRIKVLTALAPEVYYTQFNAVGFSRIRIGENAQYTIPKTKVMATAVEIDVFNMPDTSDEDRERILSLRRQPVQEIKEEYGGYITKISYKLRI